MRPEPVRKYPWVRTASFSKAAPPCPAKAGGFSPAPKPRKSRRNPAAFCLLGQAALKRLQPLGTAPPLAVTVAARPAISVVAAIPIAATVTVVALKPTMTPAAAETAFHAGQDREASLLAVVERLVERIGGIGDLLQRRSRGPHGLGALTKARHRVIGRRRPVAIVIAHRVHARIGAVDPELGEFLHRGFNRRPKLFLIGAKLQSGVDRGNPRIGERRAVLGAHAHVIEEPG